MLISFEGQMFKTGKFYEVEVAPLLLRFQANTQKLGLDLVRKTVDRMLKEIKLDDYDTPVVYWIDQKDMIFNVSLPLVQPVIATVLKQLRLHRKMSLSDVAEQMGLATANSIAAYECTGPKGREPSISKLSQYLSVLEIDAYMELSI